MLNQNISVWLRALLVLLAGGLALPVLSQTSRGTVTGTVLDPSGAVITGARVTLNGVETGVHRSTVANESGTYRFDAVDLGLYELTVTHAGFRPFLASGIGVEANRVTTFDPRLELGASETRIEVNAAIERDPDQGRPAAGRQLPAARGERSTSDFAGSTFAGAHVTRRDSGFRQLSLDRQPAGFRGLRVRHQWPARAGKQLLLDGTGNNDIGVLRRGSALHHRRRSGGSFGANRQLRCRVRARGRGRLERGHEVGHERTARDIAVALSVAKV